MQNEIRKFIQNNKVATISCTDGVAPYSFCCFYAFGHEEPCFIFKSDPHSKHCNILSNRPAVSGTIMSSGATVLNNEGVQLEGSVIPTSVWAERHYNLRYPFAITISGKVYSIRIDKIKYTATAHGKRIRLEWAREKLNSY